MKILKNNIVLIGFMAAGKTSVAKILAKDLQYSFYDTDALIEDREKLKVEQIFNEKGEDYFRQKESQIIDELKGVNNSVISLGGGAPLNYNNAKIINEMGCIFYLDLSLDMILERFLKSHTRPLANTDDLRARFLFRRPIYEQLGEIIDANNSMEDVVKDIKERFLARLSYHALSTDSHMSSRGLTAGSSRQSLPLEFLEILKVNQGSNTYPVYIGNNAFNSLKNIIIAQGLNDHTQVIITNENVFKLYEEKIRFINAKTIIIKDGERHKNYESINHIHNELFKYKCNRKTLILAMGGGVTGDIASFAASIYLRGIPIIHVPTTLLSMVDSSIGGKTGIDHILGKNLIGSFYAPKAILVSLDFLQTLPKNEFSFGMAEVIKHAIIADKALFYEILDKDIDIKELVLRAMKVKVAIVSEDPYEKNKRIYLNLGHTFAHAIEKVSDYKIAHGQAVSMGLMYASKLSKLKGILVDDFSHDLEKILEKYDLPTLIPKDLAPKDIVKAMAHDKKQDNHGLKMILPLKIGQVISKYIKEEDILKCLTS